MNKKRVNALLPKAKEALIVTEIVQNGQIAEGFTDDISYFAAIIIMGSLKAAVSSFASAEDSLVERKQLVYAVYYCLTGEKAEDENLDAVLRYFYDRETYETREAVINISVALKLAMNYFEQV